MTVIQTKTNHVCAYEALPAHTHVHVVWHGPPEEGSNYLRPFGGMPVPITQYQETVDWAVSMADAMAYPLHVLPVTVAEGFARENRERLEALKTDEQRAQFREHVVTTCVTLMRDSDDSDVREGAFSVLVDMGVVDQ